MKNIAAILFATLFASGSLWGMAVELFLPDAIKKADVVAHIKILEDVQIVQDSDNPDIFTRIATAEVVRPIKGSSTKERIKLLHTNGYLCPNVIYDIGKEYIVFLKKNEENQFLTMNWYAGQFWIEDGNVHSFYLMPDYKDQEDKKVPLQKILDFLDQTLKQKNG